jgi:hypothetical protein
MRVSVFSKDASQKKSKKKNNPANFMCKHEKNKAVLVVIFVNRFFFLVLNKIAQYFWLFLKIFQLVFILAESKQTHL